MATYLKYAGLILICLIFLLFGIHVLVKAYLLNDPFAFILTFFSSNFIILISAALIVGLVLRLRHQRGTSREIVQSSHTAGPQSCPPYTDEDET